MVQLIHLKLNFLLKNIKQTLASLLMVMPIELLCVTKKERLLMGTKLLQCLLEDGNLKKFKRWCNWNSNVKLWFRKIFKTRENKIF